jgi:hypothetical protein
VGSTRPFRAHGPRVSKPRDVDPVTPIVPSHGLPGSNRIGRNQYRETGKHPGLCLQPSRLAGTNPANFIEALSSSQLPACRQSRNWLCFADRRPLLSPICEELQIVSVLLVSRKKRRSHPRLLSNFWGAHCPHYPCAPTCDESEARFLASFESPCIKSTIIANR